MKFANKKKLAFGFFICLLLLPFQNCSQVGFVGTTGAPKIASDNNGTTYGGKVTGDYLRFVPGFTCAGDEQPNSIISVTQDKTHLLENTHAQCAAFNQDISSDLVDKSIYQSDVVGYVEGIFEGFSKITDKIPANLVEVWCRDQNDQNGIETITHFNRSTGQAVNRTYYTGTDGNGLPVTRIIPDSPVSRVIGQSEVIVQDEQGFALHVYRNRLTLQPGIFAGTLEMKLNGQKISRDTFCRLGGSVDPKVWPAKEIVDSGIETFSLAPDLNSFMFSNLDADGAYSAYRQTLDKANSGNLIPAGHSLWITSTVAYSGFLFSPDSRYVYYSEAYDKFYARSEGFGFPAGLMRYDTLTKSTLQFSNSLNGGLAAGYARLSPDSNYLIFLQTCENSVMCLMSVPTAGGPAVRLDAALAEPTSGTGVTNFVISKTKNKVVFLCCHEMIFGESDLYSVNFDGSDLVKINTGLPPGVLIHRSFFSLMDSEKQPNESVGDYVFVNTVMDSDRNNIVDQYGISISGNGSFSFSAIGANMIKQSPSGLKILFKDLNFSGPIDHAPVRLINLDLGKSIPLPNVVAGASEGYLNVYTLLRSVDDPIKFSREERWLIAKKWTDRGQEPILISTSTGDVQSLCPGVAAPEMSLGESFPGTFLLAALDLKQKKLIVYSGKVGENCRLINSVPVDNPKLIHIHGFTVSPDNKKILITVAGPAIPELSYLPVASDINHRIFMVPLDGTPAAEVNFPSHSSSSAGRAQFLADSKTVIFIGDQVRQGKYSVMLWTAP